jgi:hypothetical protein
VRFGLSVEITKPVAVAEVALYLMLMCDRRQALERTPAARARLVLHGRDHQLLAASLLDAVAALSAGQGCDRGLEVSRQHVHDGRPISRSPSRLVPASPKQSTAPPRACQGRSLPEVVNGQILRRDGTMARAPSLRNRRRILATVRGSGPGQTKEKTAQRGRTSVRRRDRDVEVRLRHRFGDACSRFLLPLDGRLVHHSTCDRPLDLGRGASWLPAGLRAQRLQELIGGRCADAAGAWRRSKSAAVRRRARRLLRGGVPSSRLADTLRVASAPGIAVDAARPATSGRLENVVSARSSRCMPGFPVASQGVGGASVSRGAPERGHRQRSMADAEGARQAAARARAAGLAGTGARGRSC